MASSCHLSLLPSAMLSSQGGRTLALPAPACRALLTLSSAPPEVARQIFGPHRWQSLWSQRGLKRVSPVSSAVRSSRGDGKEPVDGSAQLAQQFAETIASPVFYLVAGLVAIGALSLTGETVGLTVAVSALPVVGLTLLSKSSVGKQVQDKLQDQLPQLEAEAYATRLAWKDAMLASPHFGSSRPVLPAALGGSKPYLTGQLPGDYGFDPLELAADSEALERFTEYELLHARWAMLGATGCLIPELLDLNGVDVGEPIWWKVGAAKLAGDITINYAGIEGFRIAGKQGLAVIAVCQVVLMGGPEYARYVGIKSLEPVGVFLPGDKNYPGGTPFDPLEFSKDADGFVEQTVKEIKNGRLAMVAMLGYAVQAVVTGQGPVRNLLDFSEDPMRNNIISNLVNLSSHRP